MCISPTHLPNGQLVGCRKCWQCKARAVDDWTGRCIAETKTSRKCHSITLTYGRDDNGSADHVKAAILTYSDVQKYFKYLREDGYPLRYIVVGEYGTLKKRAHWHLIAFWQEKAPEIEALGKRFNEKHWDHGYSFFEPCYVDTIRYVCKYIQKEEDRHQYHMSMSKKPPLGHRWFMQRAARFVKHGLSADLEYHFADVQLSANVPKKFRLQGTSANNFLAEYVRLWKKVRPGQHMPPSEELEKYLDANADTFDYTPIKEFRNAYEGEEFRKLREIDLRKHNERSRGI